MTPKSKKHNPSEKSPFRPQDRKAFLEALRRHHDDPVAAQAELDQHQPDDTESEFPSDHVQPEAATPKTQPVTPAAGKKITVTTATDSAETPETDGAGLEAVLEDSAQPPKTPPPEMGKLQRSKKRRSWPWGWTIGGLLVIAVATVGGFLWFNRAQRFSGDQVNLSVQAPSQLASGSDVTITFAFQNSEPVDLVGAELTVEYPEGFRITKTSQPSVNDFTNAFTIGTIKHGRAGTVTVDGVLFGSVGAKREFSATLNYRPKNFSSDFQVTAKTTIDINSSLLELKVDGPKKLAPNAEGTWTLTYTNSSDRDLSDVQIEAIYPDGIDVTAVDPAAVERSALWRFDQVPKGESGKITITGHAVGEVGDSLEMIFRAGLVNAANTVDVQAEQKILVVLISTGVTTSVAANGVAENSVISPGERLQYAVKVANQSEAEVSNLTVSLTVEGTGADFDQLDNPTRADVQDQTLTWTKQQVSGLDVLKPGQDVTLRFGLGTVDALPVAQDTDIDPHITVSVSVTSPSLPVDPNPKPAAVFTTKFATAVSLTAESRYYDDDGTVLGDGPVPPQVGQTTKYRVRWTLTNTTSAANSMHVTATLPTSVFWTGQNISRGAGDIAFDPSSRVVTWTINQVPAGTGSRLPALVAEFEVSITPIASQVGSPVILTQSTAATATDAYTDQAIALTQPSTTTDVPTDPTAAGQGSVVAAP